VRSIPSKDRDTEFVDMWAAYDGLDEETKSEVKNFVYEHSQIYSRAQMGFTDFSDEERARFQPVRQAKVRVQSSTGRKSMY